MKKTILSVLIGFSVASQAFADDLYQVYQQALQNDPATLKAEASKDAAFASIGSSKANLLPQISLSLSASRSGGDADSNSNGARVSLTQSLYNPTYYARLDRAELVASQADAYFAVAKQDLIVRTVGAYFNVLQAMDDLEFAQAEKRAIERQLEQTSQRFAVGLTAKTDVHEAQALFDNAVASEISAKNNVEIKREALREITGAYHPEINQLDTQRFSAGTPTPQAVEEWLTIADERNTQLMAANIGVDISKQDIDIATTGYYPDLSLSANVDSSDTERNGIDEGRSNTNYIGVTLSVPLYEGGSTQSGVEVAKKNFIADSEERERIHRSVVRSVRSNFYDVTASIARIKALQQAVVSAESALSATEAGFDVGTRTIVDVLNSTRNLYDAKRNLASARYGYIISILSLKQAAGSLSDQDVMDINRGLSKS
ncbi:outer membrane channel protein TolC [Neptunicella marina]|uniref:Outer membrane channel protein TolC n=1 Tax=Neptunicella marina TaxID=2125989 RepID=A0A8J6IPS9_9ALTE|nr:outer membrane channel protein TolC [Neptunicella marina]MBC3764866.1 outer membrane channel protein TolC [Neptunicella marina]